MPAGHFKRGCATPRKSTVSTSPTRENAWGGRKLVRPPQEHHDSDEEPYPQGATCWYQSLSPCLFLLRTQHRSSCTPCSPLVVLVDAVLFLGIAQHLLKQVSRHAAVVADDGGAACWFGVHRHEHASTSDTSLSVPRHVIQVKMAKHGLHPFQIKYSGSSYVIAWISLYFGVRPWRMVSMNDDL